MMTAMDIYAEVRGLQSELRQDGSAELAMKLHYAMVSGATSGEILPLLREELRKLLNHNDVSLKTRGKAKQIIEAINATGV